MSLVLIVMMLDMDRWDGIGVCQGPQRVGSLRRGGGEGDVMTKKKKKKRDHLHRWMMHRHDWSL